jgi:hypothetical protein
MARLIIDPKCTVAMVLLAMPEQDDPTLDSDEPIKIDLDPEEALKALLKVDPQAEPVEDDPAPPHGDPLAD